MPVAFDTLKLSEELTASGFSEEQARGLSRALRDVEDAALKDLATKEDIRDVRADMLMLKSEIERLELRLTVKLGALIALAVGIVVTLIKHG
jgi:hypothetical protein